ncbi:MAG: hypothetical protein KC912_11775 [Proteobacteria bacterium]|nr:hypothetical protein [Pseudomonadota bacterium]
MVPSDYRLPNVANGLIARLEGTRRSYADDPQGAEAEFSRIAEAHLTAAVAEMEDLGVVDAVQEHGEFLRSEIHQTFLPRYRRLAIDMNRRENQGFGLGPFAEPAGRAALVVAALLGFVVFLRLIYLPWAWPLFLIDLSLPVWPDILRTLYRRRYATQLQEVLDDLGAVQEQATAYALPADVDPQRSRPRQSEAQ